MIEIKRISRKNKRILLHLGFFEFPSICYSKKYFFIPKKTIKCVYKPRLFFKGFLLYGWIFLKLISYVYKFKCPTITSLISHSNEFEFNIDDYNLLDSLLTENNLYEYLI